MMVEAYIRLSHVSAYDNVDTLVLGIAHDYCLDELAVLYRALSPKYISLVSVHSDAGEPQSYQWRYRREP